MKANRALYLSVAILSLMACLAKADEWDQKTIFTFSAPVGFPAKCCCQGRTSSGSRTPPRIETSYRCLTRTRPNCTGRSSPSRTIGPSRGASPSSHSTAPNELAGGCKAWFYPGDKYGHDFVYPKPKAVALAKVNKAPVPSMPANSLRTRPCRPAHAGTARRCDQEISAESPKAERRGSGDRRSIRTGAPTRVAGSANRTPRTASSLPLFVLEGLMSLVVASGVRMIRMKLL